MLEECWRPAFARYLHVRFTRRKRDLANWLRYDDYERADTDRLSRDRISAERVYGATKVTAR